MTIDRENAPDWLLSLANTVQALVRYPSQMEYVRQRVRECVEELDAWRRERTNYYELEIVKDPRLRDTEAGRPSNDHVWGRYSVSPGELIEGWTPQHLVDNDEFPYKQTLLPLPHGRTLNLSEQFTILAAIHDYLLRGGEPIDPWREEARAWWDSPPPHVTGELFLPPGSTYYQLRAEVGQLQERDRPVLETFVENVKRDMECSTAVSHSKDFSSVCWWGVEFDFSAKQAMAVSEWMDAWKHKTPLLQDKTVQTEIEAKSDVKSLFKGHPAWGTMIVEGDRKGTHRLSNRDEFLRKM